jgi:hypothetical protein
MPFSCDDTQWLWLGVAWCLATLAPILAPKITVGSAKFLASGGVLPTGSEGLASEPSGTCPAATLTFMAVRKKRSISMPPELDAEIAAAAEHAGMSYSAWLADTARKEFTIRAGLAAASQFETDHEAFTPDELTEAEQWAATAGQRSGQTGTQRRTA